MTPRPQWKPAALAAVLAVAAVGCGTSSPSRAAGASSTGPASRAAPGGGGPEVEVAHLVQVDADVLVTRRGYALYVYFPDRARAVTCAGPCAVIWPPLFAPSASTVHVTGGAGVRAALLGTDPDPVSGTVVTYDHWPLYTYGGDPQPGVAVGEGLDTEGGLWSLIRPDGSPVLTGQ